MLQTAKKAAIAAGEILKEHFGRIPEQAVRTKTKNDFLSFVDETSEQKIISEIKSRFPDHSFLAEEGGAQNDGSPYLWIIDPLDGTKNYISGIPVFAISIALQHQGELVLGVIYDPMRNEMFTAEKGRGAHLNDRPIRVSNKSRLADSLLATGFPFKAKHFLPTYLAAFQEIFLNSIGMRRMGAAAIDMAYLAAGRFDGFWEIGLSAWDVAAGTVIIREAGGKVTDFWNGQNFLFNNYLLVSNSRIHRELTHILTKHFPSYQPVYETGGR